MSEFNYEEIFMGAMEGKPKSYIRKFKDDYRLKNLTTMVKSEDGRILDIGCGGGITTESLQYYYPKADLYGCDVSNKAIYYARKLGSGKVKYSVIKGKKLPYKNNFFDLCICLDVMEHIPDVDFFLDEVRRILKPDGKFFIVVPTEGQPLTHTWIWQKIGIGEKMTERRYGHIHPEFTHKYVEKLLSNKKIKVLKREYSEHFIFQFISVFTYFLPLELMDYLLGKRKADKYKDRALVKIKNDKKKKKGIDPLMVTRSIWLNSLKYLRLLTAWELDLMKNQPITAWKIIILSKVKK